MQEKSIKIGEVNLSYKEFGEGNPYSVVLLHGWGGSSNSWLVFGSMLSDNGYHVIIPDLPGFGNTAINKAYTLVSYSGLIEKFINKLEIKNFILWGHSNGGAISTTICSRGKLSIDRLILNNSAGIRNDTKRSLKRKLLGGVVAILKPFKKILNTNNASVKKIRSLFYRCIGSHDYINSEENPFLTETYKNMISSDLENIFKTININTLLIWGENDTYTPVTDGMKIRGCIPQSKLIILDGEKHGIHLHKPEKLLNTFLDNI